MDVFSDVIINSTAFCNIVPIHCSPFVSTSTSKLIPPRQSPKTSRNKRAAGRLCITAKRGNRIDRSDEAFVTCTTCGNDEIVSRQTLLNQGSCSARCSQCRHEWVAEISMALTIDGLSLLEVLKEESSFRKSSTSARDGTNIGNSTASNSNDTADFTAQVEVKLYVSGLPPKVDDSGLREMLEEYGQVREAKVIFDRAGGRSRGFGFVTIVGRAAASAAMDDLSGSNQFGRRLTVRESTE